MLKTVNFDYLHNKLASDAKFQGQAKKRVFSVFSKSSENQIGLPKKNNDSENFLQTLLAREKTSSALYNKLDAKKMGIVK